MYMALLPVFLLVFVATGPITGLWVWEQGNRYPVLQYLTMFLEIATIAAH
jgi:hypothetical protein